jgi:hypothetical protein
MWASAPNPLFLMARGETGLETLIDSGQIRETAHFPEIKDWMTALNCLNWVMNEPHNHKTLVADAGNGFERLCHEHVCQRDFKGDWGKAGFSSYQAGYEVALADWRLFLSKLDAIREARRMAIILICHHKIAQFRNPEGSDYDRYTVDMHQKTWSLTAKWADIVLFMNYYTVVDKNDGRAKGKGGVRRVMYTERSASWDAKNRHGLPPEIEMGTSGKDAWDNFIAALKAAKAKT